MVPGIVNSHKHRAAVATRAVYCVEHGIRAAERLRLLEAGLTSWKEGQQRGALSDRAKDEVLPMVTALLGRLDELEEELRDLIHSC